MIYEMASIMYVYILLLFAAPAWLRPCVVLSNLVGSDDAADETNEGVLRSTLFLFNSFLLYVERKGGRRNHG